MSLNLSKLTLIVFVVLLTSCTSSLKFDSKYCSSDGKWTNQFDHSAKYISVKKVGFGNLHLNLNQVLQNNKLKCREVKTLAIRVEKDWSDALLSIIPGFSAYQVHIQVK